MNTIQSKVSLLTQHITMLQTQLATLSLTVASLESQLKNIDTKVQTLETQSKQTIPISAIDLEEEKNNLSIDDNSDESTDLQSEGYDTDENPVQTHRVKTRIPRIKNARQKFVLVNNYMKQPDYDSGYDDSD